MGDPVVVLTVAGLLSFGIGVLAGLLVKQLEDVNSPRGYAVLIATVITVFPFVGLLAKTESIARFILYVLAFVVMVPTVLIGFGVGRLIGRAWMK